MFKRESTTSSNIKNFSSVTVVGGSKEQALEMHVYVCIKESRLRLPTLRNSVVTTMVGGSKSKHYINARVCMFKRDSTMFQQCDHG